MKIFSKSFVSCFAVLLLLLSVLPVSSFADEAVSVTNSEISIKAFVFGENVEDSVKLYKEDSINSDVLANIPDNTEISVVETGTNLTNIQYIMKDTDEIFSGYVENKYLVNTSEVEQFLKERTEKDTKEEIEQSNQTDESKTTTTEPNQTEKVTEEQTISVDKNVEEKTDSVDKTVEEKTDSVNKTAKIRTLAAVNTSSSPSINGVAVKSPTNIYSTASSSSKVLKNYAQGSILKYRNYNSSWYECTVYLNGKATTGYISKNDVENLVSNPKTLKGIGLKNPTKIYSLASTSSQTIKSYDQGSVLKYETLSSDWYKCSVSVNGKYRTGYIHKSDVENIEATQKTLHGIGLKSPTKVYSKASTTSKTLKSYANGTVLKYNTLTSDWYECIVYINGKATTGYIKKSDVQNSDSTQKSLQGIALKGTTKIYSGASTNLSVLKSYSQGTVLVYKTFVNGWYECKVYINGKARAGYIKMSDVENIVSKQETINGTGIKSPTKVYSKASTSSKVLKSYKLYTSLKYKTFTSNWYECTVYINGEATTGYININDVRVGPIIKYSQYNSLNDMLNIQLGVNPQTDKYRNEKAYVSKDFIKLKSNTFPTKGEVTADVLNVRAGAGTEYWVYGTLKAKAAVDVIGQTGNWYIIDYSSFRNAKPADVKYYLDPSNFALNTPEYYQFLLLNQSTNITANDLNNKILYDKGVLKGKGSAFVNASKKYNINEIYLISHALLETGNGTSQLAKGVSINGKTVYNVVGYGAYDSCPVTCGAEAAYDQGWFTIDKAIEGAAKLIGANYIHNGQDTLYKMRWNPANPGTHQYASDIGWAVKQVVNINKLYNLLDQYTLYFDVPVYK